MTKSNETKSGSTNSPFFVVETDIPPPGRTTRGGKTPARLALESLAKAGIGASVLLDETNGSRVTSLAAAAAGSGWFTTRSMPHGTRVWKTAEPKSRV